jgi:catalase
VGAIEAGAFPEWELGVQIITEEQAEKFTFDISTRRRSSRRAVPVRPIGRHGAEPQSRQLLRRDRAGRVLHAHVVPGIDFSNDPLLAGRIHSYVDTQISRLGGPNFHEIPINAPVAQVHNNTRDGMHRQAIHRGRVSYEPNSLGGGCPVPGRAKGFVVVPRAVIATITRSAASRSASRITTRRRRCSTTARRRWSSSTSSTRSASS